MSSRFTRAPYVLVVIVFGLVILFGAFAPALDPLFEVFQSSDHVQDSDVVGPGDITRIMDFLFIYGPLAWIAGGVLFLYIAALRLEGVLR